MNKKLPAWIVLTVICLVAALALAFTYNGTKDRIAQQEEAKTVAVRQALLPAAASYLEIEEELADEILYEMIQDLTLELDLINGREFIFTPKMHQCEIYIAARMLMMLNFPAQSITGVEEAVAAIEAQSGIQYAQQQKQAITEALSKGMLILTGGPGTGKTTTLNGSLNILGQNGERVYLAVPTARAALRM